MEDYYAKKARRKGSVRFCKSAGCKTVLSRYNDSDTCGPCESKETESARRELLRSLVGSR